MRASCRLPALNLFQGRLAPPTDGGGGGWGVVGRVQAGGANPESMSSDATLHPNLPQSPAGGRRGSWSRKEEQGDWVPSQMEGLAIKHGSGTNHGVW